MEKKDLLILMNGDLRLGGIETYYYRLAKFASSCGTQVVLWINKKGNIDSNFISLFQDENIRIIRGYTFVSLYKIRSIIKENKINTIRIMSCSMFRFVITEFLKQVMHKYVVYTFLLIPHFRNRDLFYEEGYEGPKKEHIKKYISRIILKLYDCGNLYFFDTKHIETVNQKYGLNIKISNKRIVPKAEKEQTRIFDAEQRKQVWSNDDFRIITISRFSFPHKGYIVGLIRSFGRLKKQYSNLKLDIVGYGDGQKVIEEEINKLPLVCQKDIALLGSKNIEEIRELVLNYNLNISLAGCYNIGVSLGVLSIPARHHSYDCEVYGFSPEANLFSLSSEPGENVEKYIEAAITMSEDIYIDYCKRSFDSSVVGYIDRIDYFDMNNTYRTAILSLKDILFVLYNHFRNKLLIKLTKKY